MHIETKWFNDQFNVEISSQEGKEAFLTVRGCRIMNGANGEFVSYPATKNANSGKWWNHCQGSDAFNAQILKLAKAAMPQKSQAQAKKPLSKLPDDFEQDIPF